MLRFSCVLLFLFYDLTKGSDDIQVEARVRIDPAFMKRMEKTFMVESALLRTGKSISHEISDIKPEKDDNILKQLIPQFSRNNPLGTSKTVKEIHEKRLEKKGIEGIESVAEYLRLKFNLTIEESLVKESCEIYASKLKSYFNFMSKKETSDAVEKEHIVLDKVDMAVTLQSSLERTLMNEVLAKNSNISKDEQYIMSEAVFLFITRNKQTEMIYICKAMGICRVFPGYSDHFAQILSEVLKLYDVKFQYFVIKAAQLLVSKRHFLKTVLRHEVIEYLKEKSSNIVDANINDMRESISVLRSVITQRHSFVNVVDAEIKARTKATRIILDIIDTVFDKIGIEEVQMRAETVMTGIQDWAANLVTDIGPILDTFITDSVATMKHELSPVAKKEFKTLADIIYFGKPVGDQNMAEYLMTKGSKFTNGMELGKSEISDFSLKLSKKPQQLL